MTRGARIRHAVVFRHAWRNELERVAPNVDIRDGLLNGRHVARHALAALTVGGVLCMKLDRTAGAWLQHGIVALQADGVPGQAQIRLVFGPMHIVAGEAPDALQVHLALHVIVSLHPILVCRPFRPVRERRCAQLVLLELPTRSHGSCVDSPPSRNAYRVETRRIREGIRCRPDESKRGPGRFVTGETVESSATEPVGLGEFTLYFLRLGATGFGGPIALAGFMQRDLVEERRWVTRQDYLDGLALAQLAPGPLAAQLAMYLGYVRGGILGATSVALAFILPSFVMVWAISVAYVAYGGWSWMQALFYGIGAAVIGIIARSAQKLAGLTLGRSVTLWSIFVVMALATAWAEREIISLFLLAGILTAMPALWRARHAVRVRTGDRHHDPDSNEERASDVWSLASEQLYGSGSLEVPPTLSAALGSGSARYESIVTDGHRWRMLTGTTSIGDRAVVLRVSRSEDRVRGQVWEVLVVLVLGLPLVVVLAGVGGYLLARRALTPIDHLASEARRITAERLHERLSVPNPHDEIGRLATVINDTFARLESSFDRLRRFTTDASHELRTPLAVIRGIGEVGMGEARNASEHRETIGSMLEEVDRLTNLVDTLLRLSHGDAGTARLARDPTDLGGLTNEVVSSLGILAEERNQRLAVDVASRVVVSVDRFVLREAITNIVDNAIKYSPPGSTIDVRVRADGDQAIVAVGDEGPGIAAEHRERVFDRFFRLDEGRPRDSGGTGLGLAIAKWAVEINGGHVTVEERPTGGSVFRIVLPVSAAVETASESRGEH